MTANGEFPDPAERERAEGPELDPTQRYEIERIPEPEPGPEAEPTEIVEVIIPSPHLPVPRPPVGVVVRRRRLALLYGLIALLLVVLGGMAYAMISNNHKQLVAVDSTTSATPSAQASPADTGSDASDDASSSASASGYPATSGSASPGASASDGSSAASTDTSDAGDPSSTFTPPFGTEYLPAPVDGGNDVSTQQDVHISDIDYANSSTFYCHHEHDHLHRPERQDARRADHLDRPAGEDLVQRQRCGPAAHVLCASGFEQLVEQRGGAGKRFAVHLIRHET